MNILNPPKNYIDYRCAIHGKEGAGFDEARKKFYKTFDCKEEIIKCFKWLYNARNTMSLPVEQIEVRESDGKKHGRIVKMMIYDIEYWRESNIVKQRKIYIPLESINDRSWIRDIPKEAWRKREWPLSGYKDINPVLIGEEAERFEEKREKAKQWLPYKDDEQ